MHRVFGIKEDEPYVDRKGAYLIAIQGNKVAVVRTEKGYFLLGGRIEQGECDEDCIIRECLEETGYSVTINEFLCSAETYTKHPNIGFFHPIQNYYYGEIMEQIQNPKETDHFFEWVDYNVVKDNMFVEMQNWALKICWAKINQ